MNISPTLQPDPESNTKQRLVGMVLFVSVFVLMLALFEFCFWLVKPQETFVKSQPKSVLKHHPELGYQISDDGVYETSYHFSDGAPSIITTATLKGGIRQTPVSENSRHKFAVFFGDSFTFGVGVNDDETLPYYFGEEAAEYRPYNYGVPGGAVQNMYHKLSTEDLTGQIKESSGIAVYWYFGFHTNRVVGGMPGFNKWADTTACYELENDTLVLRGNFRQAHPWRSFLYDMLYLSSTCRYVGFYLPVAHTEKHYDTAALMLLESIRLFKAQFPKSDFIVLFWNGKVPYLPVMERLNTQGVHTITVRDFLDGIDNPQELPNTLPDGHLLGQDYKRIAEGLAGRVQETGAVE